MATNPFWRKLIRRLRQHANVRAKLGDYSSEVDDIIRPRGMKRRDFHRLKDRSRKLEAEIADIGRLYFGDL